LKPDNITGGKDPFETVALALIFYVLEAVIQRDFSIF
jgi:hypothetical protein